MTNFDGIVKEDLQVNKGAAVITAGQTIRVVDVIDGNAVFHFNGQLMWADATHFQQVGA